MDLRFTEMQEMLRKASRDFLTAEGAKVKTKELEKDERGYPLETWRKMAELGWMGLVIPQEYEGMGGSFQDLTVLLEEMGRSALTTPFLSTTISTFVIMAAGSESQKKEFLPRIASGELVIGLAFLESSGSAQAADIATKAAREGDVFVINGTKMFVEMAHAADYLICIARTSEKASSEEGLTLFLVDAKSPGIRYEMIPSIGDNRLHEVRFSGVRVPAKNVLGKLNGGWPVLAKALQKGAIAKCAESVGGMETCVELTVAYSKERVQYDRPIGAFQALQHIMADLWTAMETSKYLTYKAAWMESEGLPCSMEASAAKAYVNDMFKYVSKGAIRLHGAIGTSQDHAASLYYRRAKAADTVFGSTDYHRELVSRSIGLL